MPVVLSIDAARRVAKAVKAFERDFPSRAGRKQSVLASAQQPDPFRVELYKQSASVYAYTIYEATVLWWSSDHDTYKIDYHEESAEATFSAPSAGDFVCIYAKLTIGSDTSVVATYHTTAAEGSMIDVLASALDESTGNEGAVRILPLVVVSGYGRVYTLHRGVWYIGRES